MLHTKFRENQPAGSLSGFYHIRNFRSSYPLMLHILCDWPSGFRDEDAMDDRLAKVKR